MRKEEEWFGFGFGVASDTISDAGTVIVSVEQVIGVSCGSRIRICSHLANYGFRRLWGI